ncbi:MAG: PP2C family protein-serine/threonine phosphatase [Ktedonobacterales bacterium]
MSLHLNAAAKTDVGRQREQNEDACYTHIEVNDQKSSGIFIVADGMGGYHAGEVASQIAIDTISSTLQNILGPTSSQPTLQLRGKRRRGRENQGSAHKQSDDDARKTRPLSAEPDEDEVDRGATVQLGESLVIEHYSERLRQAIEKASQAIVEYGDKHREAKGLGSTVTAALVIGEQAFIANVGDSRTYLLRNGKLSRVTTDHSLVERLVEAGQIDRADVYDHPNRNLIYRSLGAGRSEVEVDIFTEKLQGGDVLMLCSDGLWEMVKDAQMESIITEVTDLVETCDLLIQRANENGGEDNITVVLMRCVEG